MKPARLQSLVDRLLARDERYRPLDLLLLTGRLDPEDLRGWEQGEPALLEDVLAGQIEGSVEQLRQAAEWARRLGLSSEAETSERRLFRNSQHDRLARTVWRRKTFEQPQGDLFFDNRYAVARASLARSLLEADQAAAETHLAEMARIEPGNEAQADAEHLVGALAWLEGAPSRLEAMVKALEEDLAPRARRFFGHSESERYLARFWAHLAETLDPAEFDPARPDQHPSALAERLADWAGVIAAVEAVDRYVEQPVLLARLAGAALELGQREQALAALCQLCWRHGPAAERWLDSCDDAELTRRVERYWDLEPALPIERFPAWLVLTGYPMPDCPADQQPAGSTAEALAQLKALRQNPADLQRREWLQVHEPALFALWIGG